jgi:sulfoxide reductase catalytic subunit YedY
MRSCAGALAFLISGVPKILLAATKVTKRILPKGTEPGSLADQNPAHIDTRHLEIMKLNDFGVMGDEKVPMDANTWKLEVAGDPAQPSLSFSLEQIRSIPAVEKDVLMICPGFFSNHGHWKGVSLLSLLDALPDTSMISNVYVTGESAIGERRDTFAMEEVRNGDFMLAYQVNGVPLPVKHGYPLRLVAPGHMGFSWTKYVKKVEFV